MVVGIKGQGLQGKLFLQHSSQVGEDFWPVLWTDTLRTRGDSNSRKREGQEYLVGVG